MINNVRTAVHPKSEAESRELIGKFYKKGYKWDDILELTENDTNYHHHGRDTAYYVELGIIKYTDLETCLKHKYHIIAYK